MSEISLAREVSRLSSGLGVHYTNKAKRYVQEVSPLASACLYALIHRSQYAAGRETQERRNAEKRKGDSLIIKIGIIRHKTCGIVKKSNQKNQGKMSKKYSGSARSQVHLTSPGLEPHALNSSLRWEKRRYYAIHEFLTTHWSLWPSRG